MSFTNLRFVAPQYTGDPRRDFENLTKAISDYLLRLEGKEALKIEQASGAFTTLSCTGNATLGDAITDTLNVGNGGIVKDASGNVGIGTAPSVKLDVNGVVGVRDAGTKNRNAGMVSELAGALVNFGLNDDSGNRFGGSYTSADQGGFLRVDSRGGSSLFNFFARAAGSTSGVSLVARVNTNGSASFGTGGISDFFNLYPPVGQGVAIFAQASAAPTLNLFSNNQTTGEFELGQGWTSGTDNVGYVLNRSNADVVIGANGSEVLRVKAAGGLDFAGATPTVGPGHVGLGSDTATTATAGTNGAPPAQVAGYWVLHFGATVAKIPYYAN